MGEIIGGIFVMALFIAFVMWKNKGKNQAYDPNRDMSEQQYWADKNAENYSSDSDD